MQPLKLIWGTQHASHLFAILLHWYITVEHKIMLHHFHGSIMYYVTQHAPKVPVLSLCRNISPAAGCLLQHQCLPGVFRAGPDWAVSGHEVMWQLLLCSQVLKAADCHHVVDLFPSSAAVHHTFFVLSLPADITNWSGVRMGWTAKVTRRGFLLQEARTATSSCTTPQRSWQERAMWS